MRFMDIIGIGDELERISSRDIHILVSQNSNHAISDLLSSFSSDSIFTARDLPHYSRTSEIEKDGDLFRIRINGGPICIRYGKAVKCQNSDLFNIKEGVFGYTISLEDKCLTAKTDGLFLEECKNGFNLQEFTFKNTNPGDCMKGMEESAVLAPSQEVLKSDADFEKEIEKMKVSKKMKPTMKRLWDFGFKFKKLKLPKFNVC